MSRKYVLEKYINSGIVFFIFMMGVGGLVSFFIGYFKLPHFLMLYKEVMAIILAMIMLTYTTVIWYKERRFAIGVIILFAILIVFFAILMILFNGTTLNVFFSLKLDIIPIFFATALMGYLLSTYNVEMLILKIFRTIVIVGLINGIVVIAEFIIQRYIEAFVVKYLGHYGVLYGVKIITVKGNWLRAFGLTNGFVQAGDLLLITLAIILFIFRNIEKRRLITLTLLLIFAIFASIYKSAYLGLIFLFFILLFYFFAPQNISKVLGMIWLFLPVLSFLGTAVSITDYFYWLVLPISPYVAQHSLLARHNAFLRLLSYDGNILLGYGLGKHGTYLPTQTQLALDSLFIYITANYGIVMFIFILLFAFILLAKIIWIIRKYRGKCLNISLLTYFLTVYFIFLESWFNNILGTYPISYLFLIIIAIYFRKCFWATK